jgi:hypothetical protein
MDTEVAQRVDGFEAEQTPTFASRRSQLGSRLHLEDAHEIERQDTQQLPCTVRRVAHRGQAIEGEAPLELAVDLFVNPASAHERPESLSADHLVGHDSGILVVPVAWVEQIKLKVLRGLVLDAPPIHDHSQPPPPACRLDAMLGARHLVVHTPPQLGLLYSRLEPRPRIEGYLDCVLGPVLLQQRDDLAPEKRAVHAKFQLVAPAQRGRDLRENRAQEPDSRLPVVNVTGSIVDAEDLAALRLVSDQSRSVATPVQAPCAATR